MCVCACASATRPKAGSAEKPPFPYQHTLSHLLTDFPLFHIGIIPVK